MIIFFRYTNKNMGGWEFIRLDTDKKEYCNGNTASTSVSYSADVRSTVRTKAELEDIKTRLGWLEDYKNLGRL